MIHYEELLAMLSNILLPGAAAGLASYLVAWIREYRGTSASATERRPNLVVALSALMGAISASYRATVLNRGLIDNIVVMFLVGGFVTALWYALQRFLPRIKD